MFVLNAPNNYCVWLHKLVKYLRSVRDMRPALHALHSFEVVDEDIP
jgi:hypothetical protein